MREFDRSLCRYNVNFGLKKTRSHHTTSQSEVSGCHLSPKICDRYSHISLENVSLFDNFMIRIRKKWGLKPVLSRLYLLMLSFAWKIYRQFWLGSLNRQLALRSSVPGDCAGCGSAGGAGEFWLRDRENCGITKQLYFLAQNRTLKSCERSFAVKFPSEYR